MSEDKKNNLQLYGTDSLCFDKNDFIKVNFDVDTFVHVYQASGSGSLEVLRDDLGIYLKILRSAMIDLINRDYADFVNLSTNLTGLDSLIDTLKTPLGQLREEVLSVETMLSETISSITNNMSSRHKIIKQKSLLHRLNQIAVRLERLELILISPNFEKADDNINNTASNRDDLIDRLATEISHLNFLVSQCEGASLLTQFKPRVDKVCNFVEVGLERRLSEGININDHQLLIRVLRTYASLGMVQQVQSQVKSIICTQLEEVISDEALKSNPRSLHGLFTKTLTAVRTTVDPLITASAELDTESMPTFSFLEVCAWPEIVSALEIKIEHIFNPGDPDAFLKRYEVSLQFLDSFESLLGSLDRIEKFRQSLDYVRFMELWNLPVYFQIRYHEIGQVLESSLSDIGEGLSPVNKSIMLDDMARKNFQLNSSQAVWCALLRCFHSEVFLLPLLHRFWKLCLLILSRHRTWIKKTIENIKTVKVPVHISQSMPNLIRYGAQPQSNEVHDVDAKTDMFMGGTNIAVAIIHDVEQLSSNIRNLHSDVLLPLIKHLPRDKLNIIEDTLAQSAEKYTCLKSDLIEMIIESLIESSVKPLKHVSDTPRIYRRTNKALPHTHQSYVSNSIAPIESFSQVALGCLGKEQTAKIIGGVFSQISSQYHSLTYEVLVSVHKMEESLRRLKKARERGMQGQSDISSGPSDDDKIRMQICLDVEIIGQRMSSLGVDPSTVKSYGELFTMVHAAKEGKFSP